MSYFTTRLSRRILASRLCTALSISVVVGGIAISGCSGQPAGADQIQYVRTIAVDPTVALPQKMHYVSTGQVWAGALGGLIGAAIAAAASPQDQIRLALAEYRVDVDAIFASELRAALARQHRFQLVDGSADATFRCTVKEYGFHTGGAFTSHMKVLMKVESNLQGRGVKPIFHTGGASWNSDATIYSMDEYLLDRNRLLAAFHESSAGVAVKQVNALLKRAGSAERLTEPATIDIARDAPLPRVMPAAMPVAAPAPAPVTAVPAVLVQPPAAPVVAAPATQIASAGNSKLVAASARLGARVRAEPTTDAQLRHELAAGTALLLATPVQNAAGNWWYITNPAYEGWVLTGDVQLP